MTRFISFILLLALAALGAERVFAPYTAVEPLLGAFPGQLPAALKNPDQAKWNAWSRQEDRTIRARLDQGDLDSMVNLLLFGTSFTQRPRIQIQELAAASKSGLLRARVDDLVAALQMPSENERLLFLRNLLRSKGAEETAGTFLLVNLQRVLQENAKFSQRIAQGNSQGDSRAEVFRDRGVSLDTTILPNFGIEETLRDLKGRGLLREGSVARVAVIGPGLDFADWDEGYDYYPQQTLQPFALYNSLAKMGLAKPGALEVTVFDISPRVLDHLRRARERATRGGGYGIQLPRGLARQWTREAINYWQGFGDVAGTPMDPIQPPAPLASMETRAIRIRPEVVLACQPADLNIVLQRLDLPGGQRFDLIVATNMFVYYDAFEQTLALGNVAAMLKPGGFLLSNDKLPERPGASVRLAGATTVWYSDNPRAGDTVRWYQKSVN
jgi:SAM-dependent methyltransferase